MDFHLASYKKHANSLHPSGLADTWKRFDTVDYWRHERMYNNILPLLKAYPESSWLTVGDGRYGTDANFLMRHGAEALATDINNVLLIKAKQEGFIKNYKTENAEHLTFEDNTFDFVVCKEAYHHFPRPMLALYEMLRVSRKGVLLIEPKDHETINPFRQSFYSVGFWLWQSVKNKMKSILGKPKYLPAPNYEPAGNYIYSISQRELEKLALGMNLPTVAFKTMNDFYVEGVENELVDSNGPLLRSLRNKLHRADATSKKYDEQAGLLIALICKDELSRECTENLSQSGFLVQSLPRNPYANPV